MLLRVEVTVDLEAADYLEAAEHQRRIEGFFDHLKGDYPQATFLMRDRRERTGRSPDALKTPSAAHTGRLHQYVE